MSRGLWHHTAPPPGRVHLRTSPRTPRWVALALTVLVAAGTVGPFLAPAPTRAGHATQAPAGIPAGPVVTEARTRASAPATADPEPVRTTPPTAATGSPRAHRDRGVTASRSRPLTSPDFAALAQCESSGDPTAVSPSGRYEGLYQFDLVTWHSVGGMGHPAAASPAEQTLRARLLYAERGRQPWPVCGRLL